METVPLGSSGLKVSKLGLGLMGMSAFYTSNQVDEQESLDTIEQALTSGINFFDTADIYGFGDNERLLAKAIKKFGREKFIICTKFAVVFDETSRKSTGLSGKADYVKSACAASLARLEVDQIDLYYQHRVDTNTPIEETVKAMAELVKEGKVKYLGLSECSAETLRKAHAVHPITAVQIEYSLWTTEHEEKLIPTCRELGIGVVAYSPLGRGFLTGAIKKEEDFEEDDWRKNNPRFKGENFKKNLELVKRVEEMAKEKGCSPSQLALGWVEKQGKDIVSIPGTKRVKYLKENIEALKVKVTDEEDKKLREIMKGVVGERYDERSMKALNN